MTVQAVQAMVPDEGQVVPLVNVRYAFVDYSYFSPAAASNEVDVNLRLELFIVPPPPCVCEVIGAPHCKKLSCNGCKGLDFLVQWTSREAVLALLAQVQLVGG